MRNLLIWVMVAASQLILTGSAGSTERRAGGEPICTYLGKVSEQGSPYLVPDPDTPPDQKAFEIKKIFVMNDLIDRYDYYECESYWYGNFWGTLSISIVLLTAAASLLAAFDLGAWTYGKYVLSATSAVAALLTTVLIQFHIKDTWQLRENGQVAVQKLQEETRNVQPSTKDAIAALSGIHIRAIELEKSQATQFFGQITSQASPPPSPDPPLSAATPKTE